MYKQISRYKILRDAGDSIPQAQVKTSEEAARYLRSLFNPSGAYEEALAMFLNRANMTIGYARISQGGLDSTTVDVRLVAFYAIKSLASGVILAHNHPSGCTKPSEEDIRITRKLRDGLKILDITLVDHIILAGDSSKYYSFSDEGI